MTDLEIVLSIACAVLFVVWRNSRDDAGKHFEAAMLFREALKRVATNECVVSYDKTKDELNITPTKTLTL